MVSQANPPPPASAINLLRLVAPVPNREAAILARRQTNPVARAILGSIGDEPIGRVVRRVAIQGVVQLPDIRRAGRFVNRLPRRLVAARLRSSIPPCGNRESPMQIGRASGRERVEIS